MTLVEWIALLGSAGVFSLFGGVCGNTLRTWIGLRRSSTDADIRREEHRDGLTFDLLNAARIELAALRTEVSRLRPLENHLLHMEEALDYLSRLLDVSVEERPAVERAARAFVNRMRRMQEAIGTLSNEIHRIGAAVEIAQDNHDAEEGGDGSK